jgi:hypothetical protein
MHSPRLSSLAGPVRLLVSALAAEEEVRARLFISKFSVTKMKMTRRSRA